MVASQFLVIGSMAVVHDGRSACTFVCYKNIRPLVSGMYRCLEYFCFFEIRFDTSSLPVLSYLALRGSQEADWSVVDLDSSIFCTNGNVVEAFR